MNHERTLDAESLPEFLGREVCGLGGPGAEASRLQPARQTALHHLPLIDLLLYCAYHNHDCTFGSRIFSAESGIFPPLDWTRIRSLFGKADIGKKGELFHLGTVLEFDA